MIVGSLLLILVAVGLLVGGVLGGSNILIICSIVATAVAAVILILGVRQSASDEDEDDRDEGEAETMPQSSVSSAARLGVGEGRSIPTQIREPYDGEVSEPTAYVNVITEPPVSGPYETVEPADDVDADPPDEPAPQQTSPEDAARVALLTADVVVIDGRPRYHMAGCVHLLGRESEPLPVGEALELGFTPCGKCEPDSALLADARPA